MACPFNKLDAITAPTVNDDSCNTSGNGTFENGSFWFDTVTEVFYMLVNDAVCGAAVWEPVNQKEQLTFFEAQLDPLMLGGTQVIPPSVTTLLEFDDVLNLNPNDIWDNTAGVKTLTIQRTGNYKIYCSLQAIDVDNTGGGNIVGRVFVSSLYVNGQFYGNPFVQSLGDMVDGQISTVAMAGELSARLTAGDVLTMSTFHTFPAPIVFTLDNNVAGIGLIPRKNSWSVLRVPEFG